MASSSSRGSGRIRDNKALRGGAVGRDMPDSYVLASSSNRRPNQSQKQAERPITFNVYGDVRITKGAMYEGSPPDDVEAVEQPYQTHQRKTLPATSPKIRKPLHTLVSEDQDGDTESDQSEACNEVFASAAASQQIYRSHDSGYGSSRQRTRSGINEAYLNKETSDGSGTGGYPLSRAIKAKAPGAGSSKYDILKRSKDAKRGVSSRHGERLESQEDGDSCDSNEYNETGNVDHDSDDDSGDVSGLY